MAINRRWNASFSFVFYWFWAILGIKIEHFSRVAMETELEWWLQFDCKWSCISLPTTTNNILLCLSKWSNQLLKKFWPKIAQNQQNHANYADFAASSTEHLRLNKWYKHFYPTLTINCEIQWIVIFMMTLGLLIAL